MNRAPFQKAGPGSRIFHEEVNRWNSVAQRFSLGNEGNTIEELVSRPIENKTGSDIPYFGVLGLGPAVYDPQGDEIDRDFFLWHQAIQGVAPGNNEPVGVVQEPLGATLSGPAILAGLTPVKVRISDVTHKSCGSVAGDTAMLHSLEDGLSFIVQRPAAGYTTTGDYWCLVHLNCGAGGSAPGGATCKQELYLGIAQGTIPHGGVGQAELYDRPGGTLIGTFQVDYKWFLNDATDINDGDHMSVLDLDPSGDLGLTDTTGKYLIVGADCPTTTTP